MKRKREMQREREMERDKREREREEREENTYRNALKDTPKIRSRATRGRCPHVHSSAVRVLRFRACCTSWCGWGRSRGQTVEGKE